MPSVAQLQQALADYMLTLESAPVEAQLVRCGPLAPSKRLAIYGDGYRARLIDALRDYFPLLSRLLGDDDFSQLALGYLNRHPPSHYSLRWHGQQMADFLRHTSPYDERPELAALAEFDWALAHAFDAPDVQAIGVAELAAVPPERWGHARLILHPCVELLRLPHAVLAFHRGESVAALESGRLAPEVNLWTLIWRRGRKARFRHPSEAEAVALNAIIDGADIAGACEAASSALLADEVPAAVSGWLRHWVSDGLITRITDQDGAATDPLKTETNAQ